MLDVLDDGLLLLTTSLQLDDMEHRKERRSPPNQSTEHSLVPCQESRAPAPLFQLRLSHTYKHSRLVPPCWAPLSPCSSIGTHSDMKEGLHTTPSTTFLFFSEGKAARWQNYQHELDLRREHCYTEAITCCFPKHIMDTLQTFLLKIIT